MAVVQNPLIHRASGSVGNSIFSKWKKKNTLRSKSIMPYPSPTPSQALARQRFKNCTNFFHPLLVYQRLLFKSVSIGHSALNQFVKSNLSLFNSDSSIISVPLISQLLFSTGNVESFFQNAIVPITSLRFYVSGNFLFDYNINHSGAAMLVICVDLTLKDVLVFCSVPPVWNACEVQIPVARAGHEFCVFSCAVDLLLNKSANSQLVGSFISS